MTWYDESAADVLAAFDTDSDGLTADEVARRRETYGPNEIRKADPVSPVDLFVAQFRSFLVYLLVAAVVLSLAVGFLPGQEPGYADAALILLILLGNGIFGFVQDYRAERSIEALRELAAPSAVVRRDGETQEVPATDLVPGDVVVVEQGDAIPADARLLEAAGLETDESTLTGESGSVGKSPDPDPPETPLAERTSMLYSNSSVVRGRGTAVVVATGMDTEMGSIATQLSEADDRETPFEREVDELGRRIGLGVAALIAVIAVTQLVVTDTSPVLVLLVAITLAVAAVPEGLPAVVTLTLALGSQRLVEQNALVRRLSVVESLGSVTTIVTDKTGTLTENRMTVTRAVTPTRVYEVSGTGHDTDGEFRPEGETGADADATADPDLRELLVCGAVCNDAEKLREGYRGDPTEVALLVAAAKAGVDADHHRLREIPFTAERKRMTVVADGDEPTAYLKGAPEVVLERCDHVRVDGEAVALTDDRREAVVERVQSLAGGALRVLGFARRRGVDPDAPEDELESGLVFLGLQGMIDPPREGVPEAVTDCRDAGIRVVMATGDDPRTAAAIGRDVGFDARETLSGPEIETMSDDELAEAVETREVFARVAPNHKVRILQSLQAQGDVVAMTGDGVNDAPALRNADVGVAMGDRGTHVAQQAADMVLQDDNFVTIRNAIAEGRGIFDNIRKFVNYLLSANAGEVLVVFVGVLLGTTLFPDAFAADGEALVLTPVMLLWLNLVTDGLPALALGADPHADDVMERPPRPKGESVLSVRVGASVVGIGHLLALVGLGVFFATFGSTASLVTAQTALFTFLVTAELVRTQAVRRRYGLSVWSNQWLLAAVGISLLLQLAVLYTPLAGLFGVVPLTAATWGQIGVGFVAFVVGNLLLIYVLDRWLGQR